AKTFQKALSQNPKNVEALFGLARLNYGPLKDSGKALDFAKQARTLAPEDGRMAALLGKLVYQSGDHKWAISLLQDASRRISNDADLLYDLAWAAYSVGQVEEAESKMKEAIQAGKSFSKNEDARRFLALLTAIKEPAKPNPVSAQVPDILKAVPDY